MNRFARLGLFAALMTGLWLGADALGLREYLTADGIRDLVAGAGVLGVAIYLGAFSVGTLVQIPGIVFLLGARVAYGPGLGFVLAYAGALSAISVSFFVVRGVGGRALADVPFVKKAIAKLEERPVRTVATLRTLLMVSPPLNYALAMSPIRFRDYFVGSAAGLAVPVAAWVFLSECLLSVFGGAA